MFIVVFAIIGTGFFILANGLKDSTFWEDISRRTEHDYSEAGKK